MSDTHERPTLSRKVEQDHPYAGLEQFWNFEVDRRRFRERSYTKLAVGLSGLVGMVFLAPVLESFYGSIFMVLAAISVLACGVSSLWLTVEGVQGLGSSRQLPPPRTHRAIRGGRQEDRRSEESAERQLLEVLERNGEITPARSPANLAYRGRSRTAAVRTLSKGQPGRAGRRQQARLFPLGSKTASI